MVVKVTGIPQDLHRGHDMPLRARTYRWNPGKMKFGKSVRKEGTRKKWWGVGLVCCRPTVYHAWECLMCFLHQAREAGQLALMKIPRP